MELEERALVTWRTGDWGSFHGSLDWSELSTGKQLRLERRDGQRQGPPHLSTSACIVSALEPRQLGREATPSWPRESPCGCSSTKGEEEEAEAAGRVGLGVDLRAPLDV